MAGSPGTTARFWLFVVEFISGLSRGSYLVCIGWVTLTATGQVQSVGQVFIASMLVGLFGSPLIGARVDRSDHRTSVILAHLAIAIIMTLAAFILVAGATSTWFFILTASTVHAMRIYYHIAHDALVKGLVEPEALARTIAQFRSTHLLATSLGTVAAGFIIAGTGPFGGFVSSALMSVVLIAAALQLPKRTAASATRPTTHFLTDLRDGLLAFTRNPALRPYALLALVVLPIGQLSNAVLSGVIHFDLNHDSDVFGMVDAAWPVGGMIAALILSTSLARFGGAGIIFLLAAAAGLATLVLGLVSAVPLLIATHFCMGLFTWFTNIKVDTQVLATSSEENVGRMKSFIPALLSLGAIVMCLSPSVVPLDRAADYFVFWGGVALAVPLLTGLIATVRGVR